MKLVFFQDGTYAIRRFNWLKFRYEYKDLSGYNIYWWPMKNLEAFNLLCKKEGLQDVQKYMYSVTDIGKVYKPK